ncbi:hypothetical protein GCM10009780_44820 [Actinomadura alba]
MQTWKLSTDPQCIDKARDIVGLYLDPPEAGDVFCQEFGYYLAGDDHRPAPPPPQGSPPVAGRNAHPRSRRTRGRAGVLRHRQRDREDRQRPDPGQAAEANAPPSADRMEGRSRVDLLADPGVGEERAGELHGDELVVVRLARSAAG